MAYLLDTNVFIQAKNLHYGFDFCPVFWEWLIAQNNAQRVFSIEQVAGEIASGADELATWVSGRAPGFFLSADAKTLPALANLSAWATSQSFKQSAVSTFLQVADYYLVARHFCISPSSAEAVIAMIGVLRPGPSRARIAVVA